MPLEVRYGVGATGKRTGSRSLSSLTRKSIEDEPNNIKYDDTSVDPIPIFNNNIWGTALEIDVGLFNIPHYLNGSSWLNVLTGVSYRTSTLLYPFGAIRSMVPGKSKLGRRIFFFTKS